MSTSPKIIPKTKSTAASITDSPVDTNAVPTDISDYINTLSNGDMVFADYRFNENHDVITDRNALGEVYDKALKALKATKEYKKFVENFSLDDQMGFIRRQTEDFLKNGVYTYENGEFVKSDKKVRASATPGLTGNALNTLADIDYDKAISSMITPEEARG